MAVGGTVMLTSGVGETAGSALRLERAAPGKAPDLTLADTCVLMGGAGGTAGYALYAVNASIHYEGTPELYSGDYYAVAAEGPARLEGCEESGERETVIYLEGSQVETYPANNASQIIQTELSQISSRYVPQAVENPLAARDYLVTKYEGFTVERDSVSQASLNGKGLKITLWDGTMENRLQFLQRLCSDGAEGLRMVLIARRSELWPTVETTLAALEKLHGEGFTQLAYTSAEPVYCERILDLKALLSAVHADDAPVDRLIFGTADDCVIFVREDGARDYQEELMAEVLRPLEPLPEA